MKYLFAYYGCATMLVLALVPVGPPHYRASLSIFSYVCFVLYTLYTYGQNMSTFPIGVRMHNQIRLNKLLRASKDLRRAIVEGEIPPEIALQKKRMLLRAAYSFVDPDVQRQMAEEKKIEEQVENEKNKPPMIIPGRSLQKI